MLNLILWAFLFRGEHSTSRHIIASKVVVGLAILGWLVVVLFAVIQSYWAFVKTRLLFAVPGTGEVWGGPVASFALTIGAYYAASTSADYTVTDFEQFSDVWVPVAFGFLASALVPFLSIVDRLSLLSEEADRLL
ncbi:hypothetical protein WJX81_006474 [Elliptochloris bilobata]|uniref:Uncharacterized protein n=1 Tax=Elliptochloris bilobata TaxID=381761 RepID=A0AAW1SJE7_9CHLO